MAVRQSVDSSSCVSDLQIWLRGGATGTASGSLMFVKWPLRFSPGNTSTNTSWSRRWSWSMTPSLTWGNYDSVLSSKAGKIYLSDIRCNTPVCVFTCLSVRYKLCQLLPRLRSSLRLPADKQLLQQLDFCVQKLLCREKDKDVVATIRKVTSSLP